MSEKFVPIHVATSLVRPLPALHSAVTPGQLHDSLKRPLRDLRISVTDRCNFRCVYCMPKEIFDKDYAYLPHKELLSFEEIVTLARHFVDLGVNKIRLTGGEPLLRKNLEELIAMLAQLRCPDGSSPDLSLTTNGALLEKKAASLKQAGLKRVTVSLDALSEASFRQINDVDFSVSQVLAGIEAAHQVGLGPVKVNMVVKRGMNDQEILPMARYFHSSPHILRLIEFMDVGNSNGWQAGEVIDSAAILQMLAQDGMPLTALPQHYASETASRWQHANGAEIGFISSVSQAFCGACSRARLSTDGKLYTCLFATQGYDLKHLLRQSPALDDQALQQSLAAIWQNRSDRYSELRAQLQPQRRSAAKIEMSYIGG